MAFLVSQVLLQAFKEFQGGRQAGEYQLFQRVFLRLALQRLDFVLDVLENSDDLGSPRDASHPLLSVLHEGGDSRHLDFVFASIAKQVVNEQREVHWIVLAVRADQPSQRDHSAMEIVQEGQNLLQQLAHALILSEIVLHLRNSLFCSCVYFYSLTVWHV